MHTITIERRRCPGKSLRLFRAVLQAVHIHGAEQVRVVGRDNLPRWMADELRKLGVRDPTTDKPGT